MKKRYQVFISSTFADLENERRQVMEAILGCDCFPTGMEMFPSLDIKQFSYIKPIIDDSDYYILIIAGRYGSLTGNGISYTEKEYDYAVERDIPILAFLKKDIESIPANKTDGSKSAKKRLLAFRKKVEKDRLVSYWDSPDELAKKIALSLPKAIEAQPRAGWIRGSLNDASASDNHTRKYKHYMIFEVTVDNNVVPPSSKIHKILSPDGHEMYSGLFNATEMRIIMAYPKLAEFASHVYRMGCDAVGKEKVDEVFLSFVEYDTNIMRFGLKIFPDPESPGTFYYRFVDWTKCEQTLIFGPEWMD